MSSAAWDKDELVGQMVKAAYRAGRCVSGTWEGLKF